MVWWKRSTLPLVRGRSGLGREVADLVAVELLPQVAAFDIDPGVVGHKSFRDDPVLGEEAEGAFEEAGGSRSALVRVDLRVGEAGVIVDDRVHVIDAVAMVAVLAGAVTGEAVPRPLEPCVFADVHVQQVAGAGPLVTVSRLPHGSRRS